MTDPTDIPEVDVLITVHDAERNQLSAAFAVDMAEGTVATTWQNELVAQQTAARRRRAAAKGRLTKVRKDGSADTIAAARERVDAAYREFTRISDAAITEMQQLIVARLDSNGELLTRARQIWDAGSTVIEALAQPARSEPSHDGGR
jgi:hypothetical protein